MSNDKTDEIVKEFIAWTEAEFRKSIAPGSRSAAFFTGLQTVVRGFADSVYHYEQSTGTIRLNGTRSEINRALTLVREGDATDFSEPLTLADIKKDLPFGTIVMDLDEFPHARDVAYDLVLSTQAEQERADAIVGSLRTLLPFKMHDRFLFSEAKRMIANPGGGFSYFEDPQTGHSVLVMTHSSKLVSEFGRLRVAHNGIDEETFEWKQMWPNSNARREMYTKIAATKLPDPRIAKLAELGADIFPELSYLIYASLQRNVTTMLAENGAYFGYMMYGFARECVQDALNGQPFHHGAVSTYLGADDVMIHHHGSDRALLAIDGQHYLQQRLELRLNPANPDDRSLGAAYMHAMTLEFLSERQPNGNMRTSETFTPSRLRFISTHDATKELRAIRDLYVEGAFNFYPPAALLARNVVASALLLCPTMMTSDVKPGPAIPTASRRFTI